MKTLSYISLVLTIALLSSCNKPVQDQSISTEEVTQAGQSAVKDDDSQKNIVQTAIGSADHKTLVAALKAASYVDALSNAGPLLSLHRQMQRSQNFRRAPLKIW